MAIVNKYCEVPDRGGPGVWCELFKGHKGPHVAGGYVFGPYDNDKPKVKAKPKGMPLTPLQKLQARLSKLEKRVQELEINAAHAILSTRK